MNAPIVAIVGRPNVGKSALFNALARRRISIVEPSPGVTRDRVSCFVVAPDGRQLELVDTGGMGIGDADVLGRDVERQIERAVERADLIVLVVDGASGLVPQDGQVAGRLRRAAKPVIVVANKIDRQSLAPAAVAEFHRLGLGEPFPVSALHKINIGALRDRLFELAPARTAAPPQAEGIKIAIVGQRNVGKSTLVNTLACEERVLVHELPGTTRDSVDVRVERGGHAFLLIDTAGIRRNRRSATSVEFYSHVRAEESIRRADVVLLMLDPRSRISQADKRLADYVIAHGKPCILVVNKWDLAGSVLTGRFAEYANRELPLLAHAPISFISALRNQHVGDLLRLVGSLWKQARTRVPTARLNAAIEELKTRPQSDGRTSRRAKLYYATQVGVAPPAFVLFVNNPDLVSLGYRRAIVSFLRSRLPFPEVPIRVQYRQAGGASGRRQK